MAMYHFNVTQVSRGKGQSSVASASYISGERIRDDYYGKTHDYTKKGGVLYSEILLPDYAPERLKDRETLWNEVEKTEKHPKAQLCYNFNFALQNELTYEENLETAQRFIKENFLARGMIVDYAIHNPVRKDDIPNPHVHMLIPIRPLNKDGTWGEKQHRVYLFDENNNPVLDEKGKQKFNAVPTTDWGSPETLREWRKAYADIFNEAFEKKGLTCRIDSRSYAEMGLDILPTIHEGPHVRAMEAKGIKTNKGNHNRRVKMLNVLLTKLAAKLSDIFSWINEFLTECKKEDVHAPGLCSLLNDYYDHRYDEAYSQKGKIRNIKERASVFLFLEENKISSFDDLKDFVRASYDKVNAMEKDMREKKIRIAQINNVMRYREMYKKYLPVYQSLQRKKFNYYKEKYKDEHSKELDNFYLARRMLDNFWGNAKCDWNALSKELEQLTDDLNKMELTYEDLEKIASNAFKIECITKSEPVRAQDRDLERTRTRKRSYDMER